MDRLHMRHSPEKRWRLMTAKEYLSQIRHIQLRLKTMASQLECLRSAAECITVTFSDMPYSAPRNIHKTEDALLRVLEWEERIQSEVDRLADINATIAAVSTPALQSLLVKRYICGETWEKIAVDLRYSLSQTKRMHCTALAEVEEKMNRDGPK